MKKNEFYFINSIDPLKKGLKDNSKQSDSESKKKKMGETIQHLMNNLFRILSNDKIYELSFTKIYSLCYNITRGKGSEDLSKEYENNLINHVNNMYQENLSYLNIDASSFLKKMTSIYNDYIKKIVIIQKTLLYHETNYSAKQSLPNIMIVSKNIYEKIFLSDMIRNLIKNFILENIDKDRNNILIDKFIVYDTINLLLDLNEKYYEILLEKDLLINTREYYEQDYLKNIQIKNLVEYVIYVKSRIKEEENRIIELNLINTKNKIIKIVAQQLVEKFFNDENAVICFTRNLITLNDSANLRILKDISIFDLEDKFIEIIGKSVEACGKELISEKYTQIVNNNCNILLNQEEIQSNLVQIILDLLDKLENFKKDLELLKNKSHLKILSSRISNFINSQQYPMIFAKLLPKHIDISFKNFLKNKSNNDLIINYIDKVINMSRFIIDKDVFELNHRRLLSFRLLNNLFLEDIETKFLGKLKLENGATYTHRCEVIINDIKQNNFMMDLYRSSKYFYKKFSNDMKIEFSVKVLTQGNWIVNCSENISTKDALSYTNSNTPISSNFGFIKFLEYFENFFCNFYPNKVLSHNFFLGNTEVVCKFKGRNYFISMSPIQSFVCLLFNKDVKKLNFIDISNFLKINDSKSIVNNIIPLIKSGLILVDKEDHLMETLKNNKNIPDNIFFEINYNFFNKQQRLKLSQIRYVNEKIIKSEEKQSENVFMERKYIIESNLIRIMKSKKSFIHNDLVDETIKSISNLFVPEISLIKQRIESLIERRYIIRSESDYNKYLYCA